MIPLQKAKGETANSSKVPSSCLGVLPCSCRPTPTLTQHQSSTTTQAAPRSPWGPRTLTGGEQILVF